MATQTTPERALRRVVILGANGAMGAGSAALFAAGGCEVTLVARDIGKVEGALAAIQGIARSERIADAIEAMTYADGMATVLADCDLVFECLAEDMALKREILAAVDAARPADALVATVSSGLSIRALAEGRSAGFRSHFAGVHLYNPPHMMTGVELIPHPAMPAARRHTLAEQLSTRFGRQVVFCSDTPAFAGNRIGFRLLNEVAQLALEHGVQFMDTLIGPYTGRALAPLATIDLVGWDVHQAVVDNLRDNVQDEAAAAFVLPRYMERLLQRGHLGDKTPLLGGFRRRSVNDDGRVVREVLEPATGRYQPEAPPPRIPFAQEVADLHRRGRYAEGMQRFMDAAGPEAELARRVILGYVSYALNRVGPGEVVAGYQDVDRIMATGFNWAPPSALVDLIGLDRTIAALERCQLAVPEVLRAARRGELPTPLFRQPHMSAGRYFGGQ
ncbi:MAG TPA: 3-hydroxyacyl-CoA dehydrogenase family protein [Dehalococcoidia bacterium]|nr:3-hydroxyacyl-CoA dehydrogenase family protein [Dehalococcoidia bacterium]